MDINRGRERTNNGDCHLSAYKNLATRLTAGGKIKTASELASLAETLNSEFQNHGEREQRKPMLLSELAGPLQLRTAERTL
jgi:hypothetical protein